MQTVQYSTKAVSDTSFYAAGCYCLAASYSSIQLPPPGALPLPFNDDVARVPPHFPDEPNPKVLPPVSQTYDLPTIRPALLLYNLFGNSSGTSAPVEIRRPSLTSPERSRPLLRAYRKRLGNTQQRWSQASRQDTAHWFDVARANLPVSSTAHSTIAEADSWLTHKA